MRGEGTKKAWSAEEMDLDPEFQAGWLKAQFIEMVYQRLESAKPKIRRVDSARKMGISRQALHQMLAYENNLTFDTVAAICCALGQQLYIQMGDPGAMAFGYTRVYSSTKKSDMVTIQQSSTREEPFSMAHGSAPAYPMASAPIEAVP